MDFLFSAGLLVLLGIFLTNVLDRRQKGQYSAMLQEQRTSFFDEVKEQVKECIATGSTNKEVRGPDGVPVRLALNSHALGNNLWEFEDVLAFLIQHGVDESHFIYDEYGKENLDKQEAALERTLLALRKRTADLNDNSNDLALVDAARAATLRKKLEATQYKLHKLKTRRAKNYQEFSNKVKKLREGLPNTDRIISWLLVNFEGWARDQIESGKTDNLSLQLYRHEALGGSATSSDIAEKFTKLGLPLPYSLADQPSQNWSRHREYDNAKAELIWRRAKSVREKVFFTFLTSSGNYQDLLTMLDSLKVKLVLPILDGKRETQDLATDGDTLHFRFWSVYPDL